MLEYSDYSWSYSNDLTAYFLTYLEQTRFFLNE